MKTIIHNKKIHGLIEVIAFVVICVCMFCSIKMNIVGRTLWLDEAMLAISLNTRSIWTMFLSPLAWNQSAPVGYVIIIKIIISMFGNSEFAFRMFSIFAYAALLLMFYIICKKVLRTDFPILCTAGVANIAYLLEYSNMFKPYICDALCVIAVLFFYYLYREKRLNLIGMCIIYFILIWCSNPVAFFSGGVVAYEVLCGIFQKKKKQAINALIIGVSICTSFLIMYIVWLAPTLATSNLSEFWTDYKLPLFINTREELDEALYLVKFVTQNIGVLWKAVLVLAAIAVFVNVFWKRNAYIWVITIAIALTLFASTIGFFPMSDRLFIFMIPVWVLLAMFSVHWLIEFFIKDEYKQLFVVIMLMCFMISGTGISTYHTGIAYREGEEANESLAYIQENITEQDMIYVYYPAIPIFQYKMGYNTDSVCGFENNVYFGNGFFHKNEAPEDIEYILGQKGIYLLFSHVVDYEPTDNLMTVLNQKGTLEKIHDQYLFYYSNDGSQQKGEFGIELISSETNQDGICTVTIRVSNYGDTHLNNGMEEFRVHSSEFDVNYTGEESVIVDNINPGETCEVILVFEWNEDTQKEISLYNVGKYDMSMTGVEPIVIYK